MTVEKAEVIHEPLPVPDIPEKLAQPPSQLTLSPEHQKMYDEVLAHFQSDGYALPKVEAGELREEEKFWLVRVNYISICTLCEGRCLESLLSRIYTCVCTYGDN